MRLKPFLFVLISVFLISQISLAQLKVSKDYKGVYQNVTLFSATNKAVGDTSETLEVPQDVKQGIFYLNATAVSASDSLKGLTIQGSPDGVNWINTGKTFTNVTTTGMQRVEMTLIDKYLRFLYTVAGTGISITFNVGFVPR